MRFFTTLLTALALLSPTVARAQSAIAEATVDSVGGLLPWMFPSGVCTGNTACGFVQIAQIVVERFRPLLTIVAIVVIVLYGYRMIIGQEDDVLTKARTILSSTIAGLIMVYLIDPFIAAFYGTSGEVQQGGMAGGASILSAEVNGIVNWVLVIVAALAILMLIITALKAIAQSTGEEGIANLRKTVFSVVFGIILLVLRFILSGGFVESTGNPAPLLYALLRPVSFLMGFLALAAVIVVIYAGFLCVLSMGNEENYTKAKGILIRAAIGALVILMSLALVNFVMIPGAQ